MSISTFEPVSLLSEKINWIMHTHVCVKLTDSKTGHDLSQNNKIFHVSILPTEDIKLNFS